jgi:hypothetical protein
MTSITLVTFLILCFRSVCFGRDRLDNCEEGSGTLVQNVLAGRPKAEGCRPPPKLESYEPEETYDFVHCCDHLDACYSTCGIDKQYCDDDYYQVISLSGLLFAYYAHKLNRHDFYLFLDYFLIPSYLLVVHLYTCG